MGLKRETDFFTQKDEKKKEKDLLVDFTDPVSEGIEGVQKAVYDETVK